MAATRKEKPPRAGQGQRGGKVRERGITPGENRCTADPIRPGDGTADLKRRPGFLATTGYTQPVYSWAFTRSWWKPLRLSREQWPLLFAEVLPEQRKQDCVFVIAMVETAEEIGREEYWVEEHLAIGGMGLDEALALPVAGEA